MKILRNCGKITLEMEAAAKEISGEKKFPPCFGDEAKYVTYIEDYGADCECARCSSESDCGEYILLKCSRELIF